MLLAALVLAAAADPGAVSVRVGEITDPIVCTANPKRSYALFLPRAFVATKPWPILYVYDPRKRGRLGAELFQEVAERRGFIVASSNDTESDNPDAPNGEAIDALWRDSQARLPIDPKRIYATGFSGGSRLALAVGQALDGGLAGVIAVAAGFSPDRVPSKTLPFGIFGTVGTTDFNFYEMKELDTLLAKLDVPHRVEIFDGEHSWPPPDLAVQAVEWLELQAMKAGRIPRDDLIETYWKRELGEAQALETAGRTTEAFVAFQKLDRDLAGLRDTSEAQAGASRLRTPAEAELKRREKMDKRDLDLNRRNRAILDTIRTGDEHPILSRIVMDLGVEKMQKEAEGQGYEADSAKRRLNEVAAQSGFYLPFELMRAGEYRRAATSYAVAAAIRPKSPNPPFNLARANARLGLKKEALAALGRALDNGFEDRQRIESDPDLASIRGEPAYAALLARLPKP